MKKNVPSWRYEVGIDAVKRERPAALKRSGDTDNEITDVLEDRKPGNAFQPDK